MANFNTTERLKLEKIFGYKSGYVLDFSNRTFEEFFKENMNIGIYNDKYSQYGDSKGARLRCFFSLEDDKTVGLYIFNLLEYYITQKQIENKEITNIEKSLYNDCWSIASNLAKSKRENNIEEVSILKVKNFNKEFIDRNFCKEIEDCCMELFNQNNYFHAVLEATKLYNNIVQEKSKLKKDGQDLMMQAFGEQGILKITNCSTETEKNFEEGIKFLSAGLVRAFRNPTAHEKKTNWSIDKDDCLDILSLVSYLLKQIKKVR